MVFSDRVDQYDFQGEFLDVILKAAANPSVISFAGGLPNPASFPTDDVQAAANKVFDKNGYRCLQYNSTDGYIPLRQKICDRYNAKGLSFEPEDIIITTGSQQGIDLFTACVINKGDEMIVENPAYLAALQVFHHYGPKIHTVDMLDDGIDTEQLAKTVSETNSKFIYMVPNFQNPTGLTYTEETREKIAEILKDKEMFILEDNPYGELRYTGVEPHSMAYFLPEQTCLVGTFSKVVAPGLRVGWLACKNKALREKLSVYKGAMDLHTSIFDQMLIEQYLEDNDLDAHLEHAKAIYKTKAESMMAAMDKYVPKEVKYTRPEGGMFLWATLPEGMKGVDVQNAAIEQGVVVLAGDPFYEYDRNVRTMRINFSNATDEQMETGMKIFGDVIKSLM